MKGEIKINGVDQDDIYEFAKFSAYVQQDDLLHAAMTVRECLEFAAKLKLPGSEKSKIDKVN